MYGGVIEGGSIDGGMVEGGSVTDELWLFDTDTLQWTLLNDSSPADRLLDGKTPPGAGAKVSGAKIACAGHSAHIVDGVMYVLFGHNPVYGFLGVVQTYSLSECGELYLVNVWSSEFCI